MKVIGTIVLILAALIIGRLVGGSLGRSAATQHVADSTASVQAFLAEIDRFKRDTATREQQARQEYLGQLKKIDWDSLLDMTRLQHDPNFAQSRSILKSAEAAFDTYRDRARANQAAARREIAQLNISSGEKESMLSGYNTGISKSEELFKYEEAAFSEYASIFDSLSSDKSWKIDQGAITFYSQSLQTKVHSHLQTLREIAEKEHHLRSEIAALVRRNGA